MKARTYEGFALANELNEELTTVWHIRREYRLQRDFAKRECEQIAPANEFCSEQFGLSESAFASWRQRLAEYSWRRAAVYDIDNRCRLLGRIRRAGRLAER